MTSKTCIFFFQNCTFQDSKGNCVISSHYGDFEILLLRIVGHKKLSLCTGAVTSDVNSYHFSWKSFRCWKCEHWHTHSDRGV